MFSQILCFDLAGVVGYVVVPVAVSWKRLLTFCFCLRFDCSGSVVSPLSVVLSAFWFWDPWRGLWVCVSVVCFQRRCSACRSVCWKRRSLNVVSSACFDAVILAGFNWWASYVVLVWRFFCFVLLTWSSVEGVVLFGFVHFFLFVSFPLLFQNVVQGAGFRKNRCTPVWRKRCCQV